MASSSNDEKNANATDEAYETTPPSIQEFQLGVWKLKIASEPWHFREIWVQWITSVPVLWHLAVDIFYISPYIFAIYLTLHLLSGLEESVLLHQSNKLLRTIENSLREGTTNGHAILYVLLSRIAFSVVFACVARYRDRYSDIVHAKVTSHFSLLLMKANLGLDLPTSQEKGSKPEVDSSEAWAALKNTIACMTAVLNSGSQLAFISQMSRSNQGPLFVLISICHPLATAFVSQSIWNKISFGYISSPEYQRIRALEKFADGGLRQDIISGGLAGWITDEFQRLHRSLGDAQTMHPYHQFEGGRANSILTDITLKLLEFAPMAYGAINAIINPHKFSLTSIAILQQSSTTLRYSFRVTIIRTQMLQRDVLSLKTLYKSMNVSNSMIVGTAPYPSPADNEKPLKGMGFQLNNVSFSYPGSQKITTALKEVSLTISPGQLVVIVGANGSGKSTLIRILSRLYDPTSGVIQIDGKPSADYRVADLHEATALLSQDNKLYPLSLGENIGLGYTENVNDEAMVIQAARDGGAEEFITKLKDGMKTVLEPILDVFHINLQQKRQHVLYQEMEGLRKTIDISGGERQRVVGARSFMRFRSGKVKFVAVDEPSSALDAEAELKLFDNLIKVREGKTMVFVTHRFGHLTRHADQIICMKDGSIIEIGTHDQLMAMEGEYANLYEIQARAFSQPSSQIAEKILVGL